MDNFIVSARKYRPDNFMSVVGQDSITRTLKNAIKTRQLAQAYLFCGPRGVGKTTCARIFAKTINCINISPEFEACNECESCKTFNESRSMNIHELDAASNNSVDDIRNLIDQVRIPPQVGRYSVYIIDEVHMLSTPAFNAFLKTLEEPPKHVIFILATTEKHKIIPTILSRCQIFDFNRISIHHITERLQFVADSEHITADPDALSIIAQKADGAMRDALSIFDQIVSFSGNNITYNTTIENLNVLNYDYYFRITTALLNGNYPEALSVFSEVIEEGFDGGIFVSGLASHFRDLLMCKDPGTVKLLEVGVNIQKRYHEVSSECPVDFLFSAIELANEADYKYKNVRNKRLLVEICLLKISQAGSPATVKTERPQVVAAEPAKPYQQATQASKPTPQPVPPTQHKPVTAEPETPKTVNTNESKPEPVVAQAERPAPATEPLITPPTTVVQNGSTTIPTMSAFSIKNIGKQSTSATHNEVASTSDKTEVTGEDAFDNDKLSHVWDQFSLKLEEKPRLHQLFKNTRPVILRETILEITLANKGLLDMVETIKPELLQFIKVQLNNKNIEIQLQIAELPDTGEGLLYTDEEKLKYMINKKPEINNLMQQLDLGL